MHPVLLTHSEGAHTLIVAHRGGELLARIDGDEAAGALVAIDGREPPELSARAALAREWEQLDAAVDDLVARELRATHISRNLARLLWRWLS